MNKEYRKPEQLPVFVGTYADALLQAFRQVLVR